jgi:hypothetical protein
MIALLEFLLTGDRQAMSELHLLEVCNIRS